MYGRSVRPLRALYNKLIQLYEFTNEFPDDY